MARAPDVIVIEVNHYWDDPKKTFDELKEGDKVNLHFSEDRTRENLYVIDRVDHEITNDDEKPGRTNGLKLKKFHGNLP